MKQQFDLQYYMLTAATLFIISFVFFTAFPIVDIQCTKFFTSFLLTHHDALAKSSTLLALGTLSLLSFLSFLLFLINFYQKKNKNLFIKYSNSFLIILYIILIPILLNHIAMKQIFRRPRPFEIKELGGGLNYTMPWQINGECKNNCSFPSGHATAGFSLYILVPIFMEKRKIQLLLLCITTILGCIIGFMRLAIAQHFISDIVFAGFIAYFFAHLLASLWTKIQLKLTQ